MNHLFKENVKLALQSIKGNALRAVLTMLIIAIGLTALVGILTAIDAIKQSISSNFSSLGANTFTIRNREMSIRFGRRGKKPKKYRSITYNEAKLFKERFNFNSIVSVSTISSQTSTLLYNSTKSNPNIMVVGADENYLVTSGYEVSAGRNFSPNEAQSGINVILLGSESAYSLFKNSKAVDKIIHLDGIKYKVIGVLAEKGSSMGMSGDKIAIIPINNARIHYSNNPNSSFVLSCFSKTHVEMETAINEATGLFRLIRKVRLGSENNFEIIKSDSLSTMLISNISYVTIAATVIGFITLLGAAIGLLNIMLVSVNERTKEIGIRKSLGANQLVIKNQFLIEAIIICQIGGLMGIVFGIIVGNITSFAVGIGFIIPWKWIMSGIALCFIVGISAGYYPAAKAAGLDPVEALRHD